MEKDLRERVQIAILKSICGDFDEGKIVGTKSLENNLMDFIEQELDKAERRGLEKALGFIIGEGNISWAKDKIVESIKLLEEENGKQNAR